MAPGFASAQSSVGSAYGRVAPGAVVTLTDADTGVSRTATANASGDFSFAGLAPGSYRAKVSSGGVADFSVSAGNGSPINFVDAVSEVVIRASNTVNPIDVKSVESTTIFNSSRLDALPVGRNLSSVALLAPGTVSNGNPGAFGNLVSIGGSSVAENGYYINGFDVTNLFKFVSYADLPFDAVAQQQIKTGGYGAEYGRSLGGVVSVVTKRGTNKWKFGGSAEYTSSDLRSKPRNIRSIDPDDKADNYYTVYSSDNTFSNLDYSIYASGPIIKDKLFIFALLNAQDARSDTYGRTTSNHVTNTSPKGLVKLDYYLTPNHHFEYTGIYNKDTDHRSFYQNAAGAVYTGKHGTSTGNNDLTTGGDVNILKYNGQLTDSFSISAMFGRLKNLQGKLDPATDKRGTCVRAYDSQANRSATNYVGCYDENNITIPDLNFQQDTDVRKAYRLDAEWNLGDHKIRFGYDAEDFSSSHRGTTYTGGAYWRHYKVYEAAGRTVNGVLLPTGTFYARLWNNVTGSGIYKIKNTASYIEDSWQALPNLLVYGGLRSESFNNMNSQGVSFAKADKLIAPRLGLSWDVNGDGNTKVFANAGRYYIPISSNTNVRSSGIEYREETYYYTTGFDPATGLPTGKGAQIGPYNLNGSKSAPLPESVTSKGLTPMFQDEVIIGAQHRFDTGFTLGVRSVYRDVKNGMDDHCSRQPYVSWMVSKGVAQATAEALAGNIPSCQIINPGKDVVLSFDSNNDGVSELNTIAASYFRLPKYKRKYLSVEFFGDASGPNWSVNGSYTLSASRGNVEGYVNSTLGQDDAGATQDFDNALFEDGAEGYLPNDHRHVFKLFGNYSPTSEITLGGNLYVASGAPLSCQGFIPLDDPRVGYDRGTLSAYSGSSFYCLGADGKTRLTNRGSEGRTDWIYRLDANVAYKPKWAEGRVTFIAQVNNVFNLQGVEMLNQSSAKGSASSFQPNPNYLQPIRYQTPRSLRLIARYNF
ncbi:TonB-dependent receptor [uncultured Caulobacter sp.]|uniref:TonB-dependent receptor n=1 Tax=uncultured Caulobacter sp. TaxID=158749 RepID=UPI0026197622|nr:TonB-dependent receptor [uncultured Caulobacter sp.]